MKRKAVRKKSSSKPVKKNVNAPASTIVAVGASAGGLESFTQLLGKLRDDTGLALIFLQHLDPSHPSLSPGILSHATTMPVTEIRDRERVEPNHIYVLPSNFDLSIEKGILRLMPRRNARGPNYAIDTFFQSLAIDQGIAAVGIVLSGTAMDGTEGLRSIKAEGGITIAQSPDSAKYDGMPRSAIDAGVVDLVLRPQEIADELARIATHPYVIPLRAAVARNEQSEEENAAIVGGSMREIIAILKKQTQVDFSDYKTTTLGRRIARRVIVLRHSDEREYLEYLKSHPEEVKTLLSEILIHVTEFFRDPEAFRVLKQKVFPRMMKDRAVGTPIRIWVAGCSTGEEAYSLSIALLDFLGEKSSEYPVQIFASDISESAIQKARLGSYTEANLRNIPPALRQRFFTKTAEGFKINKAVRELCLFSRHDVTSDPPFAKADLVSCRNLLIYFTAALQKRVIPLFHYALNAEGFLFLGHSESVSGFSSLFRVVDKYHKIYEKKPGVRLSGFQFPTGKYVPATMISAGIKSLPLATDFDMQKESDRLIALKFGPSGVVVNDDLEILSFRGRTVPFLEQSGGSASHRLLKMAHPELVSELRTILKTAKRQALPARREGLRLDNDGVNVDFSLEVIPLNLAAEPKDRQYLVLFEKEGRAEPRRGLEKTIAKNRQGKQTAAGRRAGESLAKQRVDDLQQQLTSAKEYQRALTEDYEATQEEFTAANEELQSANEELQSTNEELETAKEELQSTNEELTTVNDELRDRNSELGLLNDDLVNLLGSVEIPIVIVGGDGRIRRFTPAATALLNLIPGDVGRPARDIRSSLKALNLEAYITMVLETMKAKEVEVQDQHDRWFRLQVRPYRTMENKIDGVVLIFTDIERLKNAHIEMWTALNYANAVADALQIPSVVLDRDLRVRSVNRVFSQTFGATAESTEGRLLSELGGQSWNNSELKSRLESTVLREKPFQDFEITGYFPESGTRTFLLSARKVAWLGSNQPESILLSLVDITNRKKAELALLASEEKYRELVESAHDAIVAVDTQGTIQVVNAQTEEWFGYERNELIGKTVEILVPLDLHQSHIEKRDEYFARPESRRMGDRTDLSGLRKDGTTFPIEVSLSPVETPQGAMAIAIIRDVTWRRQYETERKELLARETAAKEEAEKANLTKDQFLATLSHELRTPLTSMLLESQLMRRLAPDDLRIKRAAEVIERGTKAQAQLIDDLLDISRIVTGKLKMELQRVTLAEVARDAISTVQAMATAKSVTIFAEIDDSVGFVSGDAVRLQQVVWNLLTNAVKFTSIGGKVVVKLGLDENGRALLRVRDEGIGIEPAFLPQIFERFTQAEGSITRAHGGLGIGLAIVRHIVEMHGGSVHVESAGKNQGSTFSVVLPVLAAAGADPIRSSDMRVRSGLLRDARRSSHLSALDGMKILIVDDDVSTREVLTEMLEHSGVNVRAASSALEALRILPEFVPDEIISDIAMPGEDGYSLLRTIRKLSPSLGGNTPALALTALASEADRQDAFKAGFQMHLAKPIDFNRLTDALVELRDSRPQIH